MILTVVSLALLITVGLAGTNSNNKGLSNLYIFRANTSEANLNATLTNSSSLAYTDPSARNSDGTIEFQQFYSVYLWNYCAGSGNSTTNSTIALPKNTTSHINFCSPRRNQFWFDPQAVWGLDNDTASDLLGEDLEHYYKSYAKAAKWIAALFYLAVVATACEILVGFSAIFSRWGSVATTIISGLSSVFILAFALLFTGLYTGLAAAFNAALKPYITASVGGSMLAVIWVSVIFSIGSSFFWLISSCCCSGRNNDRHNYDGGKAMDVGGKQHIYERVEGPYGQQQGVPLNHIGARPNSYEPFRHGRL